MNDVKLMDLSALLYHIYIINIWISRSKKEKNSPAARFLLLFSTAGYIDDGSAPDRPSLGLLSSQIDIRGGRRKKVLLSSNQEEGPFPPTIRKHTHAIDFCVCALCYTKVITIFFFDAIPEHKSPFI